MSPENISDKLKILDQIHTVALIDSQVEADAYDECTNEECQGVHHVEHRRNAARIRAGMPFEEVGPGDKFVIKRSAVTVQPGGEVVGVQEISYSYDKIYHALENDLLDISPDGTLTWSPVPPEGE